MTHAEYCIQFVPTGGRVLDVGSGRGKFICELAQKGAEAHGLELNQAYIAQTMEQAAAQGVIVQVKQGRAEHLLFADNFFDFVNCAEVSEHVDDPIEMCEEIFRVLKPGGRCYISFHNRFGLYDYHYRLWGINWLPRRLTGSVARLFHRQRLDSPHIGRQTLVSMHYFTYGEVRKMLAAIGFKVQDIRIAKIKQQFPFIAPIILLMYIVFLRPFYFNTFHVLVTKPDTN